MRQSVDGKPHRHPPRLRDTHEFDPHARTATCQSPQFEASPGNRLADGDLLFEDLLFEIVRLPCHTSRVVTTPLGDSNRNCKDACAGVDQYTPPRTLACCGRPSYRTW